MKETVRKRLRLVLLAAGMFALFMVLRQQFQSTSGNQSYDSAAEIAFRAQSNSRKTQASVPQPTETQPPNVWVPAPIEEDDPNLAVLEAIDLDALREVNPDVIGWITIPDTKVSYPLMQGTDNDYYLKHTWEHADNALGSIFLEYRNSADLTDFNTIVYGHNMNDGSMFGSLRKYAQTGHWEVHPYVYIVSDQGIYRYEIFACYRADIDSVTYGLSFQQTSTRVDFLTEAVKNAQQDTGIQPEITDRILTLSTCSGAGYSNRWVVQARLKMIQVPG